MRRGAGAVLLAVSALASLAAPAAMAIELNSPKLVDLRVVGSEGAWQSENRFQLEWGQDPPDPDPPPKAVEYRLYDQLGAPLGPAVRRDPFPQTIEGIEVPGRGIYTAEVWLVDSLGRSGEPSQATLRFDDTAPLPPSAQAPLEWLGSGEAAALEIEPAAGPAPISAIRGFAVSTGDAFPCASATHCTAAETDLPGEAGGAISLGTLPEGERAARVVAVSGAGVPSEAAVATFRVDTTRPSVTLAGLPAGWAREPVRLRADAADELSGMVPDGPAGPYTAIALDAGAPTVSAGDTATALVAGSGVHTVAYYARDAAGNVADGLGGAPATATVRIDETPPTVEFAAEQDPAEPERIEAFVSDSLSGPGGRGWIGIRPAGSRSGFERLPTVANGDRLIAVWDSDSFTSGRYEFLATGFDAAGNAGSGNDRARGGRMVLVNPLKQQVTIESGLDGAGQTVPYGRRARFGGRLRSMAGKPLAGLPVAVTETFAGGAAQARRTTIVRSGGDGRFSLRLAPGPAREVVASFAGTPLLTHATGRRWRLGVRAGVALRASTTAAKVGGRPVVFSGRLGHQGAPLPGHGRPVELQFRYPGAPWTEFRTVRTDRRGRFRYAYAFSDDDSRGVRFQFRALVAAEEGWPYETGYSRSVSIRGL